MQNLSNIGRIFYGIAMAGIGFCTIYYHDFPYFMTPPKKPWIPGLTALAVVFGILLVLAGASIVFGKKARQMSLLLGGVLLLIFCFGFIPYELLMTSNYMHLAEWENAAKELALAGGAFVITGYFSERDENPLFSFLGRLMPYGTILFAIPIVSFGILHFLLAKEASIFVPSWIPGHMFWMYFCGVALIGAGVAIILKIKTGLIAALLGTMILIWFIILHIPRVIASPAVYMGAEVASAFLALAYSGIAFVIAGIKPKKELQ